MEKEQWLNQVVEDIVDPERPICDPHHHLWHRAGSRYLLDELMADTGSGHNVVSTVFVECASMYRADGPEALRAVGETEFVNGVAAMTASGEYGEFRAGDVRHSQADISKAEKLLGYAPGCDVWEGLAETGKWFLAQTD